jgi:hypothetical protein
LSGGVKLNSFFESQQLRDSRTGGRYKWENADTLENNPVKKMNKNEYES